MPETTPSENTSGSATALAEPPQPPTTPPGAVASGTPAPRRKRTGLILAIVLSLVAIVFVGVVVFLVMNSGSGGSAVTTAETNAAFDSAMKKAGVNAAYPGTTVALTDIKPTGSHPFSATFTAGEVAALFNTFPYESDIAGTRVSLQRVTLAIPASGSVQIDAAVTANSGTYSGSVELPLTFAGGSVDSPGATSLSVEGIPGSSGQKAQVTGALVSYFNAYLSAAPGLTIESATLTADGVTVTGTAPDSLAYP